MTRNRNHGRNHGRSREFRAIIDTEGLMSVVSPGEEFASMQHLVDSMKAACTSDNPRVMDLENGPDIHRNRKLPAFIDFTLRMCAKDEIMNEVRANSSVVRMNFNWSSGPMSELDGPTFLMWSPHFQPEKIWIANENGVASIPHLIPSSLMFGAFGGHVTSLLPS